MTKRRVLLGLIGRNIMKSLAPALHEEALAAAGIDGHYHLMDFDRLPGRDLSGMMTAIKAVGFTGINVTFPFKQEVMPLLDTIDDEAREIGAVNTVCIAPDGRTVGYNTDRIGFRRSFEEELGRARAESAVVVLVGAGGAGRAVAFALMDLGVATIVLHDEDRGRAAALANDLTARFGTARCRLTGDLARDGAAADGIVNATPVGMDGKPGIPVPVAQISPRQWVADVIYTPAETALLQEAVRRGAAVMGGSGMSVHQAAECFRLFTGVKANLPRMRRAFVRGLAAREKGG